ncbi:MAG: PadR family transcriptional regulator [Clostridiales bacterium]|nr:PadR family transcriptional regulator [Candidatus Blautia equi]
MEERIRRVYCPMTETGFYILFCLQEPQHGYGIGQQVKQMTAGKVTISPGTMYGTLSKMENDGLIGFVREEDKRKLYCITAQGREVLELEIKRIERLYKNSQGEWINE